MIFVQYRYNQTVLDTCVNWRVHNLKDRYDCCWTELATNTNNTSHSDHPDTVVIDANDVVINDIKDVVIVNVVILL